MDPEPIKPSSSHLEAVEDRLLFLKADQELSIAGLIKTHRRAILLFPFTAGTIFGYDTIVNGASISTASFLLYFGEHDGSQL
ncbi:hypothetical protein BJX65DRAFT_304963 [Aspergillus insuetus]